MLVYSQSTSSEIGLIAWKESHEIPNLSQAVKTFWKKNKFKKKYKTQKKLYNKKEKKRRLTQMKM